MLTGGISVPYQLKVMAFYPYTSCVQDRVFEFNTTNEWDRVRQYLVDTARKQGVTASGTNGWQPSVDNKIALCVETKDGNMLFIGWYDGVVSIGYAVVYENHNWGDPLDPLPSHSKPCRRFRDTIRTNKIIETERW